MIKTDCITFPRSGHHLLINLLAQYYNYKNNKEIRVVAGRTIVGDFKYCETYNHCKSTDCHCDDTTIQKNHDFKLDFPKNKTRKYIIQVRHPLESIVSNYKAEVKNGIKKDSYDYWVRYCNNWLKWWVGFVKKWCVDNDHFEIQVITYSDIIDHTKETLINAIEYTCDDGINDEAIHSTLMSINVSRKNHIEDFAHFDLFKFSEWQKQVSSYCENLNIPLVDF